MDTNREAIPKAYKPISPWGYVGYQLLYMIPIIGFIIWIIHAVSAKNHNLRNYARSYVCAVIAGIILVVLLYAAIFAIMSALPEEYLEQILQELQKYSSDLPTSFIR